MHRLTELLCVVGERMDRWQKDLLRRKTTWEECGWVGECRRGDIMMQYRERHRDVIDVDVCNFFGPYHDR